MSPSSSTLLTNPAVLYILQPLHSGVSSRRRRARRVIFVAALIALVATSALLVINRFRWFVVSHTSATEFRNLTVSNGAVWYGWALVTAPAGSEGWGATAAKRMGPQDSQFDPVQWWPVLVTKPRNAVVAIPLWMIALPSAAVAAWMLLALRRRAGHCECGYNLTGLLAEAPCPECGRSRIVARK